MKPDLGTLRQQVREADARLQDAVRQRLEIAREIGEAKRRSGLPLRDYAIEREVVERWRSGLIPAGVAPERAEELAQWMVEESVRVQEALGPAPAQDGNAAEVLVVGGAGQMGRWLAGFFQALGHRVAIVDPGAGQGEGLPFPVRIDLEAAAREADLVAVATPMCVAPVVYEDLLGSGTKAILFDVLSIKAPILPWLRRGIAEGFHIGSVHPLFGPQVRSLTRRNLLIVDCGDEVANGRLRELFSRSSLRITTVPLHDHDRLMVDVLALPHATSLVFGLALREGNPSGLRLSDLAPTSFRRQAEAARVISHENPELSFDIQTLNPATDALFDRMENAVRSLREVVRGRDMPEYQRLMRSVAGPP